MSVHGNFQSQSLGFCRCPLLCRPLQNRPALLNLRLCEEAWLVLAIAAVCWVTVEEEQGLQHAFFTRTTIHSVSHAVFISRLSLLWSSQPASFIQVLALRFVLDSAERSHLSTETEGTPVQHHKSRLCLTILQGFVAHNTTGAGL